MLKCKHFLLFRQRIATSMLVYGIRDHWRYTVSYSAAVFEMYKVITGHSYFDNFTLFTQHINAPIIQAQTCSHSSIDLEFCFIHKQTGTFHLTFLFTGDLYINAL